MIISKKNGTVLNSAGEVCDDIVVTIEPAGEVDAGELAAIFNELKYLGYPYDGIKHILDSIYSTDYMERTTDEPTQGNFA